MEDDYFLKNYFYDFLARPSIQKSEKPDGGKKFLPFEYVLINCEDVLNEVRECDDHIWRLLMFQRTADSLGQVSRREEGLDEVLEDPEKIIAGFINFAENDNDFILYYRFL